MAVRLLLVYLFFLLSPVLSFYHRQKGILQPDSAVSADTISDPDNDWIEVNEDESELPYTLQAEQKIGAQPNFEGYGQSGLLSPAYTSDLYAATSRTHRPPWRRASQKEIIKEILRLFDQLDSLNHAAPLTHAVSPDLRPEFMGPISTPRFPSIRPPILTPPVLSPRWLPPGLPSRFHPTFPPPLIPGQMWPGSPPVSLHSSRGQVRTSQTHRPRTNYPYGQSHPIIGPPLRYYYQPAVMSRYTTGKLIARKGPPLVQRHDKSMAMMGSSPNIHVSSSSSRPTIELPVKHQQSPKGAGPPTAKSRKS